MEEGKFVKLFPAVLKQLKGLKPVSQTVLAAIIYKIADKFIGHGVVEIRHGEAVAILKRHRYFETEEEASKFTSSRFSEGIRDLRERHILDLTEDHGVYRFNRSYFRSGK